jgi:hypothetical protein
MEPMRSLSVVTTLVLVLGVAVLVANRPRAATHEAASSKTVSKTTGTSATAAKPTTTSSSGAAGAATTNSSSKTSDSKGKVTKIVKTDQEWKKELTPEQYRVLREQGT